jgi:uncharacterized protein
MPKGSPCAPARIGGPAEPAARFTQGGQATGRRTARMKALNLITLILIIIGGINWGLIGLNSDWNVVALIFGFSPILLKIVYVIVGLSGLWQIMPLTKSMQS